VGGQKSQQCHKHFLQRSTFVSERPQVRTWGRQTCFLPQAPSNLVTPLYITTVSQHGEICLQKYLPISGKLSITNYLQENVVDYRSNLTIENNLKVEKRYTIENKHNFPSSPKTLGVRVEANIPKNSKAIVMLVLCPGRCLMYHKGIENDQTISFHVTAGNVKFAVSQ